MLYSTSRVSNIVIPAQLSGKVPAQSVKYSACSLCLAFTVFDLWYAGPR